MYKYNIQHCKKEFQVDIINFSPTNVLTRRYLQLESCVEDWVECLFDDVGPHCVWVAEQLAGLQTHLHVRVTVARRVEPGKVTAAQHCHGQHNTQSAFVLMESF